MTSGRGLLKQPRPASHQSPFFPMHNIVPEGRYGDAAVEHFTITKRDADAYNLGLLFSGARHMRVEAGRYVRLSSLSGGLLEMTDTPMEQASNREFVQNAHGRVLVFGLGLGMVLHPVLRYVADAHVTVVERNPNIIKLIAPTLARYRKRVTIIEGDADTWLSEKGDVWNTIYFDIWPTISSDNLPQMGRLLRRAIPWKDRSDPKFWIGCWQRDYLKATLREEWR